MIRTLRPLISPRATVAMATAAKNVHNVAAAGFAEGTNDHYDRARPSYPATALSYIHSTFPSGATVLEAGSGTGIFSRLLLAPPAGYPSFNLHQLVAVEPSAGMRAAWERGTARLAGLTADARTVEGSFDDFSAAHLAPGTADAVIIAQAFHWCPDYEGALREVARVLKPGAPLVLVWNLESDGDAWHAHLRATYQPYDLGSPQYYRGGWRAMFETQAYKELFGPVEEEHFGWEVGLDEQTLVDRLYSKSYLTEANLSGEKREKFERELRSAIRDEGKEWIDKEKGIFKYKYVTDVLVMRRK